ncbi:MAG: HlyC/CorC family transporter [Chlamydiae bacterium]|nr:HlyC/CorC family transporter [Chlamydiota bacterium]
MHPLYETLLLLALSLLPVLVTSGFYITVRLLGKLQGKEELEKVPFPYLSFFAKLRPYETWNTLLFSLQFARFFYYLCFAFFSFHLLFFSSHLSFFLAALIELILILTTFLITDLFLLVCIQSNPARCLKMLSFPSSLLLLPCFPFLALYIKGKQKLLAPQKKEKLQGRLKDRLLEYLQESEIARYLDKAEIQLIHTMISFKDRIVREVMVPRIDIFSLPLETTIKDAAHYFSQEGYSRIPVHKETIDKVVGILLYKDILSVYAKCAGSKEEEQVLSKSVESLIKPALYTPETKKIAQLLQEFKSKQQHLAIVVDEYGGTEGIVTIEDILEELVGEIEDEHDTQEERIFSPLSSGGWIVDAKMSLIDLEEDLGVRIPQSVEYDTVGGYIFHRTGSIPGKGWKAHLDDVDLEVLSSDERSLRKIKITERKRPSKG